MLLLGILLFAGAIVGGNISALGVTIPTIGSSRSRIAAAALGLVLVAAVVVVALPSPPPPVAAASPVASGVPNIYGDSVDLAISKLQTAGYTVAATERVCSNSIRVAGLVRQVLAAVNRQILVDEPPTNVTLAGQTLARGSALVLKVSDGLSCAQ